MNILFNAFQRADADHEPEHNVDHEPNLEPDPDDDDSLLYQNAPITKNQMNVILMKFIFKHCVSGEQLEDLCKILDLLRPGVLPPSKYLFKKKYASSSTVAQAFKNSSVSYWPLLATINEIVDSERNRNMLMLGLWFGTGKPCMDTFLRPTVEEFKRLGNKGFSWRRNSDGELINSRVFLTALTCYSVAQATIWNSKLIAFK